MKDVSRSRSAGKFWRGTLTALGLLRLPRQVKGELKTGNLNLARMGGGLPLTISLSVVA